MLINMAGKRGMDFVWEIYQQSLWSSEPNQHELFRRYDEQKDGVYRKINTDQRQVNILLGEEVVTKWNE